MRSCTREYGEGRRRFGMCRVDGERWEKMYRQAHSHHLRFPAIRSQDGTYPNAAKKMDDSRCGGPAVYVPG